MEVATRMSRLGTESAFEVLAKAKELERNGVDIVHLEIGEPDFDTPRHIRDTAINAINDGETHYTPSAGIFEVRSRIAKYISETRGLDVSPDNIVITSGAKPIIFHTMLALVNPGDEVLYPNPGFPIYESMINFVGGKPVPIKLDVKKDFKIDIKEIQNSISDKTKLLVINSPNNPCGSVLYKEDLENLSKLVLDNDLIVLSDEVYNRFLYQGEHVSIATFPNMMERTIILDGMSKTYAMTGWRLGFAVVPDLFLEGFVRLNTNNISCAASVSQLSIIGAFDGPDQETNKMIEEFRQRKELIVSGLNSIKGINCPDPQGAFYVFPSIRDTGMKSSDFVDQLLPRGVACLDGESFGVFGEGCVRFSFANTKQNIEKAIKRIRDFIG